MLPQPEEVALLPRSSREERSAAKSLRRGGITALVARGAGVAVSIGVGIVTARALGPEGKGILAFLSTVTAFAVRAGSVGLDGSFAHFYLVRRQPLSACLGALTAITFVAGVSAALICELLLFAWPALRAASPLALAIPFFASIPAQFVLFVSTFVFFGLGREIVFGVFDVAYRATLLVVLAVVLIPLHGTVSAAVWVQIATSLAFAGIAVIVVGSLAGWELRVDRSLIADMLRYGGRYYSYGLFRYVLCYGGVFVAGIMLTPGDAGLFAVSLMLGEGMILFAGAINLVFYPAVSMRHDRIQYAAVVGRRMAAFCCVAALLLALAAEPLVRVVYGSAFAPAVLPFLYMLPGLILLGVEQVISSYFAARGMPWRIALPMAAGTVIGGLLAAALASQFGLPGLALATAAAQGAVSLWIIFQFAHETRSTAQGV
jgi:O-antigen/teichoic acid export membrane protein